MTHIRAFAIWLDAVYQFWLCVALSIGSNDTCSPISITFIINVYLFDCISNVRFKRFYYFFWFGTIWNVCMFIFHGIFCFKCVYFFWIFSYNFISDIFLFVFVALGIYVLFWMRKSTIKLKYFYYVVQSQACFSNSSVFSRIVRLTKSNAYKYRFYFELQACT